MKREEVDVFLTRPNRNWDSYYIPKSRRESVHDRDRQAFYRDYNILVSEYN